VIAVDRLRLSLCGIAIQAGLCRVFFGAKTVGWLAPPSVGDDVGAVKGTQAARWG
jgi:hypothetical protein